MLSRITASSEVINPALDPIRIKLEQMEPSWTEFGLVEVSLGFFCQASSSRVILRILSELQFREIYSLPFADGFVKFNVDCVARDVWLALTNCGTPITKYVT